MIRDGELAVKSTTSTRTMVEEANRLTKIGSPRMPASNFYELWRNVETYCRFQHTLFGQECGHYKSLMLIKSVLDQSGTQAMVESYTSNVCRHIVNNMAAISFWAIVSNGRYFFSKVKLCRDLKNGVWDDPPKSLLDLSIDRVIYGNVINRPNFPTEWTQRVWQPVQLQGQISRGTAPPSVEPQQTSQPAAAAARNGPHTPYVHPREYEYHGTRSSRHSQILS